MKLKDIDNLREQLEIIDKDFDKLTSLFVAVGFDYITYIDTSAKQEKIYELRDNVLYRIFASRFHLELLLEHLYNSDKELTNIYRTRVRSNGMPIQIDSEYFRKEIISLFDSFIFHLGSLFDYMSNLIEYCCSGKEKGVFKWTKLSRAVRGKGNPLCGLEISKLIDRIDRTFVGRLYDHRSFIIHERSSMPKTNSTIDIKNAKYSSKYIAPKKLIDRFSELRVLSKEYSFSLEYILIWIVNKSIDSIEDIMFGLKETMESNKKYESGFFFFKDENGEFLPPSTPYWRGYNKRNYCQQRV